MPTTGTLFSAWQATTQALQPMHFVRSIAMPQRCGAVLVLLPQRLQRRMVDRVLGEVGMLAVVVQVGLADQFSQTRCSRAFSPARSIAWWSWVMASAHCRPVGSTASPRAKSAAPLVRSG